MTYLIWYEKRTTPICHRRGIKSKRKTKRLWISILSSETKAHLQEKRKTWSRSTMEFPQEE